MVIFEPSSFTYVYKAGPGNRSDKATRKKLIDSNAHERLENVNILSVCATTDVTGRSRFTVIYIKFCQNANNLGSHYTYHTVMLYVPQPIFRSKLESKLSLPERGDYDLFKNIYLNLSIVTITLSAISV